MPLNFGSTDIDGRLIVAGPAKLYVGDWVTGGADATPLTFLGATEGGVEFHWARSVHPIGVDQMLNEIEAFPIKEEFTIKARLLQTNIYNIWAALKDGLATPSMARTGGTVTDTSSSLTIGEQKRIKYYQLAILTNAPPGATNLQRVYQFWKVVVSSMAAIKLEKTKESGIEVTWKALSDMTVVAAGKAPVLQILDS